MASTVNLACALLVVAFASLTVASADDISWTGALSKLTQLHAKLTERTSKEMLDQQRFPNYDGTRTLAPSGGYVTGSSYYGDSALTGTVTEHCHCLGCEGPPASATHFTLADKGKRLVISNNGGDVTVGGVFRQVTWETGKAHPNSLDATIKWVTEGPKGKVEFEDPQLDFLNPAAVHRHYISNAASPQECAKHCEEDPQCKTTLWKDDVPFVGHKAYVAGSGGDSRPGVRCFKYYHTVERLDCTGLPIFTCYQKKQTCTASTAASTFTAGNADNYRGWYDVQRCGTCNDYCYWDSTSASGGDPQSQYPTNNNANWRCRMADGTVTDVNHFEAGTYGTNISNNRHTTSSGLFPYQKCTGQGANAPIPSSCQLIHTAGPTPTPTQQGDTQPPTPVPLSNATNTGGCGGTQYGCCLDGSTAKQSADDPCQCPSWFPLFINGNCTAETPVPVTPSPTCDDTCEELNTTDYHGNDLISGGHTNVDNATECCQLCHHNEHCTTWTWASTNENDNDAATGGSGGGGRHLTCWLKDSTSGSESQHGRVSGGSGCWYHNGVESNQTGISKRR